MSESFDRFAIRGLMDPNPEIRAVWQRYYAKQAEIQAKREKADRRYRHCMAIAWLMIAVSLALAIYGGS